MSDSVCAVVVTYNRKNLLIECLEALQKQTRPIQGIYLIDNASTDGTPELLLEKGYISELPPQNLKESWEKEFSIKTFADENSIKLHYVRMHENTGGAGGFYEGVKRGYEKGYDWLWLMDDDAEPKEDAVENLETYFLLDNISALACLKVDKNMNILHPHRGYFNFKNVFSGIVKKFNESDIQKEFIEIDHASFVGILVNSKAIMKIGFPKKEFFIHYDDVEYCIRLRSVGKILLLPKSVIIHKEAILNNKKTSIKFLFFYYDNRNLIWLGKKYSKNKIIFYFKLFKIFSISFYNILSFDDIKTKQLLKFLVNIYLDALRGNFDNEKPKKLATDLVTDIVNNKLSEDENCSAQGIFYLRTGKIEDAKKYFQKALDINPNNINALFCLGAFCLQEDKSEKALEYFDMLLKKDLLKLKVQLGCLYNNIGVAYVKLGKIEEGFRFIKKALDLNPMYLDAQHNAKEKNNKNFNLKVTRKLIAWEDYVLSIIALF